MFTSVLDFIIAAWKSEIVRNKISSVTMLILCVCVYEACVCSAMLHGNETWGPKDYELQWLRCNDRAIIHWIGGINDRDETPSASLLQKLVIEDIRSVLHCRRLKWYGHEQRATLCIKSITNFPLTSTRKKGRLRKIWFECVKTDVDRCGLSGVDPLDRDAWRAVASFTEEVNPRLAKLPLVFNGRLANCGLTSLVKEATGVQQSLVLPTT